MSCPPLRRAEPDEQPTPGGLVRARVERQGRQGVGKKPKIVINEDSTLREGDIFLLTSDGLWAYFEDDELVEILHQLPPREASERLVTLARERGEGRGDNLSLAIIKLEPQPKSRR